MNKDDVLIFRYMVWLLSTAAALKKMAVPYANSMLLTTVRKQLKISASSVYSGKKK